MCDTLNIYATQNHNIVTYKNNKLIDTIPFPEEDIDSSFIAALPNNRYVVAFEGYIAIGKLNDSKSLKTYDINIEVPPVHDGTFVSDDEYYYIKEDNNIDVISIDRADYILIPANIKKDVKDTESNVKNLLYVIKGGVNKNYTTVMYNDKEYKITNGKVVAWFDNRYIVQASASKTIIYDITESYDEKTNILNTKIAVTAGVVHVINHSDINIPLDKNFPNNINFSNYVYTNTDTSIDIYYLANTNLTILHLTPKRDIEVTEYDMNKVLKSHNISFNAEGLDSLTADDYGFAVRNNDDQSWYYINKKTHCTLSLGKFTSLGFSHESGFSKK